MFSNHWMLINVAHWAFKYFQYIQILVFLVIPYSWSLFTYSQFKFMGNNDTKVLAHDGWWCDGVITRFGHCVNLALTPGAHPQRLDELNPHIMWPPATSLHALLLEFKWYNKQFLQQNPPKNTQKQDNKINKLHRRRLSELQKKKKIKSPIMIST